MTYTMHEAQEVAKLAAADIEAWLYSKPETISVVNVENDPDYQRRDIDLIWTTHSGEILIEIKGDRWNKTRNLFFETHSNLEKGTPAASCTLRQIGYFITLSTLANCTSYQYPKRGSGF